MKLGLKHSNHHMFRCVFSKRHLKVDLKHTHTHTHSYTHTHNTWGLTCDNAIVGRFQQGSIKLNDVLMTQDTKNLSLERRRREKEKQTGYETQSFSSSNIWHWWGNTTCVTVKSKSVWMARKLRRLSFLTCCSWRRLHWGLSYHRSSLPHRRDKHAINLSWHTGLTRRMCWICICCRAT